MISGESPPHLPFFPSERRLVFWLMAKQMELLKAMGDIQHRLGDMQTKLEARQSSSVWHKLRRLLGSGSEQ